MTCSTNIVTANFGGGRREATTAPLYQWDYGQVLCIAGLDALPQTFEVHFATQKNGGVSTTVVGIDGRVDVPNVLLTIGKDIHAWIYLSDSTGDGETEYAITIPVKERPMPEYYDVEATGAFDGVVRQVGEYAEEASAAAESAATSATAAAQSASAAAASADRAAESATAAEQARTDAVMAKGQAETAAQAATEKAQQTAQDAAQAASDAGRAESAAQSAEAAQTGAESAKTDAETAAQGAAASELAASESATSAGQAATSAAQSATAAAESATTAQGAAQTATAKAGEASASATAAAASETAAQAAQTAAEAAETNAGQSASTATTKAAEAAQSATDAAASETAAETAATRAEQAAASLTVDSALSDSSTNPVQNKVITGELTKVKNALAASQIVNTASGSIASFSDGADGVPVRSLAVEMSPIQDLHGQDSPYPAGGGKNLFDPNTADNCWVTTTGDQTHTTTAKSCTLPVTPGTAITLSNANESTTSNIILLAFFDANDSMLMRKVVTNGSTYVAATAPSDSAYVIASFFHWDLVQNAQLEFGSAPTSYAPYSNICPISGRTEVTVMRSGKNLCSTGEYIIPTNSSQNLYWEGRLTGTFTISADKTGITDVRTPNSSRWIRVVVNGVNHELTYSANSLTVTGELTAIKIYGTLGYAGASGTVAIQIEIGSTATDYEPYRGQQVTIPLGQTVYGGTVDVVSGKLMVTHVSVTHDGTATIAMPAESKFYIRSGCEGAKTENTTTGYWSNQYAFGNANNSGSTSATEDFHFYAQPQARPTRIWVYDSRFTSVADFKAYLAEHPLTVVYPLAEPLEITLDPATLSTLKGTNNVWSDADSVSVDYVADTKLYIEALTAPDADMVADANITSGHYFMVGNSLYLATANIESGGAIVPGTNCVKTNLAEALNALNA